MGRSEAGRSGAAACGLLLVDKPRGLTSHDVIARVRRHTGIRKAGHGGTLDPFATGLLLVMLGRATRLFDYFLPLTKEYLATVRFGFQSDTGDSEGELTAGGGEVAEADLADVLGGFRGTISQRVPAHSAVKVDGERLYHKARRGEAVESPQREVQIHRLELEAFDAGRQQALLRVACSKGTYIRQLAQDIGEALGASAYCAELRRTAVGDFRVEDAVTMERLEGAEPASLTDPERAPSFISCFGALYFLPVRKITDNEMNLVLNGRSLEGEASGPVRVAHDDSLLAVYGPGRESGHIDAMVVFS
ncbi:MAG: tRNA pseudouridine(55) synthase TruB [Thermoleophilia bacterium]